MASTTRRPSTAASRRAAVEERIAAALEGLLSDGATYTELGVEQIAAAAGISRSTFYLYFRDKTDLLVRLSNSLKAELFALGDDWRLHGPTGGLDGLVRAYEQFIRHYREHAGLLMAVNEVAGYDRTIRDSWIAQQEQFITRIAGLLAEDQRAERTRAEFDPLIAAQVMVRGGAEVINRQVATRGTDDEDIRVARELAEAHWYGVFRRPAAVRESE